MWVGDSVVVGVGRGYEGKGRRKTWFSAGLSACRSGLLLVTVMVLIVYCSRITTVVGASIILHSDKWLNMHNACCLRPLNGMLKI